MLNTLHSIWTLCCIVILFLIIINNPKSQSSSGSPSAIFGRTRKSEERLNKITWILIFLFFSFALILSVFG